MYLIARMSLNCSACCRHTPRAELQQEVQTAEQHSTGPDPALHASSVNELEAACRESRSRINSLTNEARYVVVFAVLCRSISSLPAGLCW